MEVSQAGMATLSPAKLRGPMKEEPAKTSNFETGPVARVLD